MNGIPRGAQAGTRAPYRGRHGANRLVLADDALGELQLHLDQLVAFALEHLVDGHAGPARHDGRDLIRGDSLLDHGGFRLLAFDGFELLLELGDDGMRELTGAGIVTPPLRLLERGGMTLVPNPHRRRMTEEEIIAYLRNDQLDPAREDYEFLQNLFPDSRQVYYGLGEIAYRRKDTNLAIQHYEAYRSNAVPDAAETKFVEQRLQELRGVKPTAP